MVHKKIKVSPSILSADFSKLSWELERLNHSDADMVHVDVMDGHFVPNLTFGPPLIKSIRKYSKLPFDVHLMISPVEIYIKNYADAGADIISFHPEATHNIEKTIKVIKDCKKKVGVAINPKTSLNTILPVLNQIDQVIIMSVNPGFAGQKFMPEVLPKMSELRKIINEKKLKTEIEIDGGIDFDNARDAIQAGADILVSGTTIFNSSNFNDSIKKLSSF
jgi:ribulose-phosphate 3-epimerase